MTDEINFVDLAALMKIGPDTTSEKFGTIINSSYFDGANLLGILYQKKLVSLSTSFPGPNPVTVTDTGKALLAEAEAKTKEEFDHLDMAVLTQLANGKRSLTDLSGAVNVRPKDLALHLYKMTKENYSSYDFRSGTIDIMLTEKGFKQVRSGMPQKPGAFGTPMPGSAPAAAGAAASTPTGREQMLGTAAQPVGMIGATAISVMSAPTVSSATATAGAGTSHEAAPPQTSQPMTAQEVEAQVRAKKSSEMKKIIAIVIIIIIIIIAGLLYWKGII